jgi:hypothetical protein
MFKVSGTLVWRAKQFAQARNPKKLLDFFVENNNE